MGNTAPLTAGAADIAFQRIYGDCGELQIGDSTSTGGPSSTSFGWSVAKNFRPEAWGGWGGHYMFGGAWQVGYTSARTWGATASPTSKTGPNSLTGYTAYTAASSLALIHTYNGGQVEADTQPYSGRLLEYYTDFTVFANPAQFDGKPITFSHLVYRHSLGPATYQLRAWGNYPGSTTIGAATGLSGYAATPTFTVNSVTTTARNWSVDNSLALSVQSTPDQQTTAGNSLITMTVAARTGNGYRPLNIGLGGTWLQDWADPAFLSDEAWLALIALGDISVIRIALGINGAGTVSKATYKADLRAFMDRLRALKTGIRFILVSQHETNNNGYIGDYTDAMYELTLESPTDTLFLNVYRLCYGEDSTFTSVYTNVNARLLSDGTHPTQTGYSYKAVAEWMLTVMAYEQRARRTHSPIVFR